MNIKRIYIITLCLCLSAVMTSVCFAVNLEEFAFYADDGTLQYDFDAYHYRLACDYVAESGYDLEPDDYWLISPVTGDYIGYDWDSFCKDYDDLSATNVSNEIIESSVALEEEDDTYDLSDVGSDGPVSVVLEDNQFNTLVELETDIPHQYVVDDRREPPVPSGCGTLFFDYSNSEILGTEENGYYVLVSTVCPSPDDMMRATCTSVMQNGEVVVQSIPDIVAQFGSGFTEDYIDGTLFFVVYNAPLNIYVPRLSVECVFPVNGIYVVEHGYNDWLFRFQSMTLDIPDFYGFPLKEGVTLNGTLKNLVISIFGEYTPVNTTALLTETVDNVTTTTLVDVVASGAAGVDWAWCAGVLLFGIMLYCLFKLLGGILS